VEVVWNEGNAILGRRRGLTGFHRLIDLLVSVDSVAAGLAGSMSGDLAVSSFSGVRAEEGVFWRKLMRMGLGRWGGLWMGSEGGALLGLENERHQALVSFWLARGDVHAPHQIKLSGLGLMITLQFDVECAGPAKCEGDREAQLIPGCDSFP
jgi:hypothetical protein